jgi:peptidoglycan hydrolase-like protein with peptidoglycan-binding domain
LVLKAVLDQSSSSMVQAAPSQTLNYALTQAKKIASASPNTTAINYAFRNESVLKRKQLQYALKKLNYYSSSIDAQYGPGTERAIIGYAKAYGLNNNTPSAIFSSVLSQVSVPSSFAVARRSNNSSSSSSSSSSGGSSAGKALLGTVGVALACSLTSNPSACLAGAADAVTGNSSSSSYGSSSNRTLKSGTWIKSGNTWIGPGGQAIFDNGRVIQGTDGSLCHRTRNAIICH